MKKHSFLAAFFIAFIGISAPAVTQSPQQATLSANFSAMVDAWERVANVAEEALQTAQETSTFIPEGENTRLQQQLKNLRSEADGMLLQKQEALDSQRELYKALGEEPEEEGVVEDPEVAEKRTRLNEEIARIDAQVKQMRLVSARADELITALETQQQERLRTRLLTRETFPLTRERMELLMNNTQKYASGYQDWAYLIALLVGMVSVAFLSIPVTRYVNKLFDEAPQIALVTRLSNTRLVSVSVFALLVFLLRFDFLNIEPLPLLEYLIKIFASICLSVVLFYALGKFYFVDARKETNELGEHKSSYAWLWNTMRRLTRFVLICIPVMSVAGYVNLGLYLAFNILTTISAIIIFAALRGLVVEISCRHRNNNNAKKEEKEQLSPIVITIIEPILAIFAIGFASFFWGVTSDDVTGWIEKYKHGIPIGDIVIDFASIGASLALFFSLYLLTKVIQWFLSSRVFPYTKLNIGIRDAILAVTGYVGIIIALVSAMGALGLDLSNLAIVAGALSVGIGFGLQAIFNNFVSGLILLFERPVKVGDWVVVGEYQGIIKKIRVRSTEIETFYNSSIIVPNSQLISETVTNWTLHDRVGRVDIQVGVAYGSDTQKVKKVLMETASKHNQVRSYPSPQVFFMSFGDSSLDFELRCFIRNIRDVFRVTSELRFDIDDAFREHNIEIPFPQRDLHIIPREKDDKPSVIVENNGEES